MAEGRQKKLHKNEVKWRKRTAGGDKRSPEEEAGEGEETESRVLNRERPKKPMRNGGRIALNS